MTKEDEKEVEENVVEVVEVDAQPPPPVAPIVFSLDDSSKHTDVTPKSRKRRLSDMDNSVQRPTKIFKFTSHYTPINYQLEYKPRDYALTPEVQDVLDKVVSIIKNDLEQMDLSFQPTELSYDKVSDNISPTLNYLIFNLICTRHRQSKNETLHQVYTSKKSDITEEDRKLDEGYLKKQHAAVILCAQIHGAFSQKKFCSFKQMNTIVYDKQGLSHTGINNLNKIGLTQHTTLLTHHFDSQPFVVDFNNNLLDAVRDYCRDSPLVQSNCDNCDHSRSQSTRPAMMQEVESDARNEELKGKTRQIRKKYQTDLDKLGKSKKSKKTTSVVHKPLYQKSTSHMLQLMKFVPKPTHTLSMTEPANKPENFTAEFFYETDSELAYKKSLIEKEVRARFESSCLATDSPNIVDRTVEAMKAVRDIEMNEIDLSDRIGDKRNIVVLPSIIGPCESKEENAVHTNYVLEALNYADKSIKPLRCGDQKVYHTTRMTQADEKCVYCYSGDMHYYFNIIGAAWPKYSAIGLREMCEVLGVKKNLSEMKGNDPVKADYILHIVYSAVFDYFIALYKKQSKEIPVVSGFLTWLNNIENDTLKKWRDFILNDGWLAIRIKESYRTCNWKLRMLCYKLGVRFTIENNRTNYVKVVMQNLVDVAFVIPTYHLKLLEYNFATQTTGDSFVANDEQMEDVNKDLKVGKNYTKALIVRNSSNFNLTKVLVQNSDNVFKTNKYANKRSTDISQHIAYLKKHLDSIFSKYLGEEEKELAVGYEDENFAYPDDAETQAFLNIRNGTLKMEDTDHEESSPDDPEEVNDELSNDTDYDSRIQQIMLTLHDLPRNEQPELTDCPSQVDLLGRDQDEAARPFNNDLRSATIELAPLPFVIEQQLQTPEAIARIKSTSLNTLLDGKKLDDEIINRYFELLKERDKLFSDWEPSLFHNLVFHHMLTNRGYKSVQNYTRKTDIFALNRMFVPLCLPGHWALIVVSFDTKTISYYDSCDPSAVYLQQCQLILNYLTEEYRNKKNDRLDVSKWKFECVQCPKQNNCYDCGVFVCQYANFISQDLPLSFSQQDMPNFRKKMISQLWQFFVN